MSLHFLESLIGGSLHGGSMLEGAWAGLARLMAGSASEIAGTIARGVVGGGASSYSLLDALTDYYLFKGDFGLGGSGGNKSGGGAAGHPSLNVDAENGLKSHAFILQQLSSNKHEAGVEPILKDYAALGANLPDENLLKRSYRKLYALFRADKKAEIGDHAGNPLAQAVGEAKAHLENPKVVNAYNQALEENRSGIEKILEKISQFDWKAAYEKAERAGQFKLGWNGEMGAVTKAQQWTSQLSGMQKTGLAFGVVAAIGLGAYGAAKVVEHIRSRKNEKHVPHEEAAPQAVSFGQRVKAREAQANMTGIG